MSDRPKPERDAKGQFILGGIGIGGRTKGARSKLNEHFLDALQKDFKEHGPDVIATVRKDDPTAYVKVIAGLLPKEMILRAPEKDLSDTELAEMLDALRAIVAHEPDADRRGNRPTHSGGGTA